MTTEKRVRSAHRLLARELTAEEIDMTSGGMPSGGTTYTTRDPGNPAGSDDGDIGGTWRW